MSVTKSQPQSKDSKNNGQKVNEALKKVDIVFSGDRMIVPENLTFQEARDALTLRENEESRVVQVREIIDAFPLDGAVAFNQALSEIYGWTNLIPTESFWGDIPPKMISVEIGYNTCIQIPWGRCTVPKIDGYLETGFAQGEGNLPVFMLCGEVKRKDEKQVLRIAKRVREIIEKQSIYRGKAIKINFRDSDGELRSFDPSFSPKFIDMSRQIPDPIYPRQVQMSIDTNLFNPVRYSERCRVNGIPLKRGILMEGPFGTGKTLTAYKLASTCVENNWTYLYLEDVRDLGTAIQFAKMYEPCVLFAEDVDRTTNSGRDAHFDKILNTLDGIESKGRELMVVLTTNAVNSINPAFIRPGRIDTVIQVTPPDSEATVKLIRQYARDHEGNSIITGTDEELAKATEQLVGANAAFVREVVERSKLAAIAGDGELKIRPDDIEAAVISILPHIKLLHPEHGLKDDNFVNPFVQAGDVVVQLFAKRFLDMLVNPSTLEKLLVRKPPTGPLNGRAARAL